MTILTDDLLEGFKMAKIFKDCSGPITSLEFSTDGEACLTASTEDESIHLYDAVLGKNRKTVYSKKYGVGLVRFTHRSNNVLCSSTKGDPAIRYLSLHDNAYLRYFTGHKRTVSALEMSPLNDLFVSGAAEDTVRLWDLRSPNCEGVLKCEGNPLIAIDPQGVVFAVALNSQHIRLYDMKNYQNGPFAVFELEDPSKSGQKWSQIKFSPDGKDLLISTGSGGAAYIINSFDGSYRHTLKAGDKYGFLDTCFSPDGNYILAASTDSKIHGWRRSDCKKVAALEGHIDKPALVKFNPTKLMIATASTDLVQDLSSNLFPYLVGVLDSRVIRERVHLQSVVYGTLNKRV